MGSAKPPKLGPKALRDLSQHSWPGNVRELENVLTQACPMSEGARIDSDDLALKRERPAPRVRTRTAYQQAEAELILAALHAQRWNITAVSRLLTIPRASLYRKLRRYGFSREAFDGERSGSPDRDDRVIASRRRAPDLWTFATIAATGDGVFVDSNGTRFEVLTPGSDKIRPRPTTVISDIVTRLRCRRAR